MRKNRMRYRDDDASRALDLLVLDVVKTLGRSPAHEATAAPPGQAGRQAPPTSGAPTPSGPPPARATSGRDVTDESAPPPRSPAAARRKTRAAVATSPAVDDRVPFEEERLLDPEEEEFVTRTADWLSRRHNPDELLAIIWTLVTEADPDGFYTPESPAPSTAPAEGSATETGPAGADPEIASRPDE